MNWSSWVVMAVAAAIGLAGLTLAVWALFGERRRGMRRCRRCWYELAADAGAGTRCPECGFVARTDRDCTRRKRRWRWAVLGVLLAMGGAAPLVGTQRAKRLALLVLPTWKVTAKHTLGAYTVFQLEARDPMAIPPRMVEVRHQGQVVWRLRTFYPEVGGRTLGPGNTVQMIGIGTDITGDGKPDLIVSDPSPGTGNFSNQFVFTLASAQDAPTLQPLAVIPYAGVWRTAPAGSAWTFAAGDRTFAYWWTTGAGSHYPSVILAWKGDHYAVDAGAMRRPAPTSEQIVGWADADRAGFAALGRDWRAPVLTRAVDLIYSGNDRAAWEYIRAVWPTDAEETAERAIEQLRERLRESPFAAEILRMQGRPD